MFFGRFASVPAILINLFSYCMLYFVGLLSSLFTLSEIVNDRKQEFLVMVGWTHKPMKIQAGQFCGDAGNVVGLLRYGCRARFE